jgi:N-acetylmuramoyl-L-alanine amidase
MAVGWRPRLLPLWLAPQACTGMATGTEVAIDVGHYLDKPGVISASGVSEFELNRKLAQAVEDVLADSGLQARLIGADGQHDSLTVRTREARGARLFVSIHHDSTREKFQPIRDPRFAGFTPSRYHADPVLGEGRPVIDWQRGIFARDALAVLNTAHSPAILIEAGVVANPAEEAHLRDPEVFRSQAAAIAAGLRGCPQG